MKLEVLPYDALWPVYFEKERDALENCLGGIIYQAHHIGSTAVEGLAAKPIIDIILEVTSLEALDNASPLLESMGYEAMSEFGISRRRYFRKGGFNRTHQIHAFKAGDPHVLRHLVFRDYLKNFSNVRREYGELKLRLAAGCRGDLEAYCDGKDAFVKHHEAKALEWASRR